jgi:hypothetical protein
MFKVTCLIDYENFGVVILKSLVLKVLKKWFWNNVTYHEANTHNQSIKCNKHVLYECTKRKRK